MKLCVIGIGHFGYQVATTLADNGIDVLVIDNDEALIASIRDKVSQAICMTISDAEVLRSIGIEEMDAVIVGMGENFAQSVLITALLKQHFSIPRIIARAVNTIHKEILMLIGADEVIMPEQEMGIRLADRFSLNFPALVRLSPDYSLSYRKAPVDCIGKTPDYVYEQYGVICVGKRVKDAVSIVAPDYIIGEMDVLVYAGNNKHLTQLTRV